MNNLLRLVVFVVLIVGAFIVVSVGLARNDAALLAPVNLILFLLAMAVYVLPSGLALYRDCKATAWIVAVNLLLGWTIIGWFAALGWAAAGHVRPATRPVGTPPTHPVPGH